MVTGDPVSVVAGVGLARYLEKVVPGSPRPAGGDDNDLLRLILPDLYQSSLEEGLGDW